MTTPNTIERVQTKTGRFSPKSIATVKDYLLVRRTKSELHDQATITFSCYADNGETWEVHLTEELLRKAITFIDEKG